MQQTKKESEFSILKGKTAVVTGSTSGIGLECARAFAGAGAHIVLNGIGAPADVEKTRTAIENAFGVKAIYSPANMAEPMEIASMIRLAEKTFGRVDVLVNNAGIWDVRWPSYGVMKLGNVRDLVLPLPGETPPNLAN
jgi:3-hydroxybutyrate dehydrogenase